MALEMINKTKWIVYTALIVSVIANGYFIFKKAGLKSRHAETKEQFQKQSLNNSSSRVLQTIDSLLLSGDYIKALDIYSSQLDSNRQSTDVLQLHEDMTSRLQGENEGLANTTGSVQPTNSNLTRSSTADPEEIRLYDSLQFALVKARAQVDNMRRQLENKSYGEYLNFKSSKGSDMYYVGQVKNDKATGRGVALLNTGSRYEGEWEDNNRHGEGTFYWPDGQYYVGGYKDDSRHGIGSYFWPNGEKFVGEWANDQRNGEGTFYGKEGEVMARGSWENDELVEVEKDRN